MPVLKAQGVIEMVVVTLVQPLTPRRISASGPLLKLRTDEQLLASFRSGNEDAFGVIVDRYSARLLRYTRRMLGGNSAEAEDVLQDVFVRAYRSLAVDSRELPLKAWLYRVAHNRCVDHLRKPTTDNAAVYEVNRPVDCDPHAQLEQREALRRLVHDVRELPEQQRSALLLRELEGLSYVQVAAALDMTVPAVKSVLVRARGGLLDSQAAQDTACAEIRSDLDGSRARGVRMSGLARRHMVTCSDCRHYHTQLREYDRAVAAVDAGPGPIAAIAKLLGFGSVGGSAAVATTGGGAAFGVGGTFLSAAAVKTVAVMATAAVIGGGAVEASHHTTKPAKKSPPATTAAVKRAAPLAAPLSFVQKLSDAAKATAEPKPVTRRMAAVTIAPPSPTVANTERETVSEAATPPELIATGGAAAPGALADEPEQTTLPAKTETTATTTTPTTVTTPTQILQTNATPAEQPATAVAEPIKAR
jgi:RNA polymerase sigma factor (sigma-70 family)